MLKNTSKEARTESRVLGHFNFYRVYKGNRSRSILRFKRICLVSYKFYGSVKNENEGGVY